jgi:alkanesulfonate monooxygenase SsuD/methylene tetrahydromethanopterin reductase-like flavin-dependent oxidoreductase (luciferase family)
VHEPVLLAKTLSSLAVMSGNRFDFGMGISPWAEDFEVANTAWEKRGKRLTEMMQIINGLMVGDYFGFEGEIFQLQEIKLCPVPTIKPKLLVGGHSKPALRRAAQYGDGWIAAGGSVEEIQTLVETLQGFRREYGTDNRPFELQAMTAAAYSVDGVKQLEDIGITELIVAFRDVYAKEADDKSVDEKRGMMEWYANEIIQKFK